MKCIYCGEVNTKTSNSANSKQGNTCRRVTCKSCGNKFYTIERAASQVDLDECRATLWGGRRENEDDQMGK